MLTFFVRKGQNPNRTKLRGIISKFSNIRKQNQNWPNLKCIQCISIKNIYSFYIYFSLIGSLGQLVGHQLNCKHAWLLIPYWWPFQFAQGNEIFRYWLISVYCFRILTLGGDGRRHGYLPLTLFFSFSFLGFFCTGLWGFR